MLTVALPCRNQEAWARAAEAFLAKPLVKDILALEEACDGERLSGGTMPGRPGIASGETLRRILPRIQTPYFLLATEPFPVTFAPYGLERFLEAARTAEAGLAYADHREWQEGRLVLHPLVPYALGSIRDDFDFGPLLLFSTSAVSAALQKHGPVRLSRAAGLYDLRLKVATDHPIVHVPEPLYTVDRRAPERPECAGGGLPEAAFAYVDPRNRGLQKELEVAATEHLQRLGAWLKPSFCRLPPLAEDFPVEASVVIPVRNRRSTIGEAVASALGQETDFPFNVLVVDNHSTDGTTERVRSLAARHREVVHLLPQREDLSIGGCWNEAILSARCGRYAVQLDSDDLYADRRVLQRIVASFRRQRAAMVIGAYTLVDENLCEIPPGLVDHREWTRENGRNNALRINGLGAPRAYRTDLVRRLGFPNVGYGEDYALALRLSREYRIGRIYESLYLCRRWSGNTDAGISLEQKNRNDLYKDWVRTNEILARRQINETSAGKRRRARA